MATSVNHMVKNGVPKVKHKMGSTVLDSFSWLTNEKDNDRINAAVALIRHLSLPDSEDQTEGKELDYALTRLVRGLGSSRVNARKGFFAALTAFLSINSDIQATRILELVRTELKTVGSDSKSEKADIYAGQVLVCGALVHSQVLANSTLEEQQSVLECLLNAGKQRSYLSIASFSFIIDFINQLEDDDFKRIVWPMLKIEVGKPWSEQTLDTLYTLLVTNEKYPAIVKSKFLEKRLGTKTIIDETSIPFISALLMGLPMLLCLRHPVYKLFCERLATTELVAQFWTTVDEHLSKPTRNKQLVAIEMLTFILMNIKDKTMVATLLTPNFLQLALRTLLNNKKKKNDEVVVKFKALLNLIVTTMKGDDVKPRAQVAVLKKLLLYPGDLMIEKSTGTKVIQMIMMNLNAEGTKKLAKLYREIAAATKPKDNVSGTEPWTNAERTYAAELLTRLTGHPAVSTEDDWRLDQLKFLFEMGLYQSPTVGVELAPLMRDSFYRALGQKLPKLNDLRTILSSLVHHLDSELFSNNETSKLRAPFTESAHSAWKDMMNLIEKLEGNAKNKQAVPIFHTMALQMGLQLFSEPEMAIGSIKDLHSCFERIERKKSKRVSEEEPEWVEVVVDLLLSLLSRSSHLLRSLVGCVFPHACPFLTPTAIHQILDVLNPKNDDNPLTARRNNDSSDGEQDSDTDEENTNEDKEEDEVESSEEEMSDSDAEMDTGDEDETVNDKLKLAVRQALGDASAQTDDEDMDIDEINEEEGKRLDHALAAAFKVLRENRQGRNKKQEKDALALTHFRVRVIDLLEMYLDSNPSMALVVDILLPLFALLEFCVKDQHQKPLENRVRSCLKKLSGLKKFSGVDDVSCDTLTASARALIDKGSKSSLVYHVMGDKLAECCTFLVKCSQLVDATNDDLQDIYTESLKTFFTKRDCVLPALLFKSVLQIPWNGNWKLAPLLLDFAFDNSIRSFKRSQALEFVNVFYLNNRLLRSDTEHTGTRSEMEKRLCRDSINILRELGEKKNGEARVVKQNFVYLLLTLLLVIRRQCQSNAWDWDAIGEAMTFYRSNVSLSKDAKSAYNRLARQLGVPATNKRVEKETNDVDDEEHSEVDGKETRMVPVDEETDENNEAKAKQTKKEKKKKQKSRNKQKDKQQLKKEARELRTKAMNDGLEYLSFSSVPVHAINGIEEETDDSEPLQNGKIHSEPDSKRSKSQSIKRISKKRSTSETLDPSFKSSKKKK